MKIIRHIIGGHQLWKRMLLLIGGLFLLFVALNFLFPLKVDIEFAPLVEARDGTVVHAYLNSQDKWRMYLEVEEITPEIKRAFLYKEDRYYYRHFGINPLALTRAIFNNVVKGKRTSGASTITMQVARLLKPKPRTYTNKMVEMFRALQLEWKFSKEEILQLYFNLVPYGGNIEGVKAASFLYFEKSPELLSLAELTSLAVIPNRPNSLTPGRHNHKIKAVRDQWLRRFQQANIFPDADIQDALEEPLTAQRNAAPQYAPHFSYRVTYNNSRALIKTTLDWSLQQKVEALVRNYVSKIYHRNIKNAAVVVLDNQDNQV
ncbi:MAG: transglycosylase domain-containing protein, partial [Cyclobacteriaceae bacterium]|nr:transglycosylase domain-containing protein [Cyclobacteriaceae bacterium]